MIDTSFIQGKVELSRQTTATQTALKRLVLHSVEQSLRRRYPTTFPERCLQASVGIQLLLRELGFDSNIWMGEVCFVEFLPDGTTSWGGFWWPAHHIWLLTEFGETVDLGVKWLHEHQAAPRGAIPVPVIWWSGSLPIVQGLFAYKPHSSVEEISLPADEQEDLDEFKREVVDDYNQILDNLESTPHYAPIVEGLESLERLHENENPWVTAGTATMRATLTFPPRIQHWVDRLLTLSSPTDQGV